MSASVAVLTAGVAALAGARLARWSAYRPKDFVTVGPWRTSRPSVSDRPNLHQRARLACQSPFAVPSEEGTYFVAETDSAGNPLSSDLSYEVAGKAPRAKWWSLTVYGNGWRVVPAKQRRYSVQDKTVPVDARGQFRIVLAKSSHEGAWLPLPPERTIGLIYRVFGAVDQDIAPPSIIAI
jgi:hypothetical protein